MIELDKYLVSCRNPRVIQNKKGDSISVPCGCCPECSNKKSIHYTSMCNNACQEHKYTLFLTLKFDEVNVPRMRLYKKGDMVYCVDVTKRLLKNGKYKVFPSYGKIINSFPYDDDFEEFYKKIDITSKLVKKLPFKNIRWANIRDLQNFLKRLRFQVSLNHCSEISFFGVSEYGPRTFRPHFHVLLYFDDAELLGVLEKYIAKCWKYGSFSLEVPRVNEGVANYVTSYINSYVSMPRYFVSKQVLPRATHSLHLGKSANKAIRDYVYQNDYYTFERVQLDTSFGTRDYLPTSYFTNLLFPKCYNFSSQTFENNVYLFKFYQEIINKHTNLNCAELTQVVLLNPCNYIRFLTLLDLDKLPLYNNSYVVDGKFGLELCPKEELCELFHTWYNRIYTAIRVSKHVMTWCLENALSCFHFVFDKFSYDEFVNVCVSNFVGYVREFYKKRDLHLLSLQYQYQDQFIKEHPDVGLDVFFPLSTLDYNTYFSNSSIIKSMVKTHDDLFSNKIKHKELNDLNNIFL